MKIIYRVDGKDFETQEHAVAHVTAQYFPGAESLVIEKEPDQDGYHLEVSDEDGEAEPVTIYIVEE